MNRQGDDIRPANSFVAEFGPTGSLRQPVGKSARVHVDRWLPFIILNRGDEGPASALDGTSVVMAGSGGRT